MENVNKGCNDNISCAEVAMEGMSSNQRIALDAGARSERLGLSELGAIHNTSNYLNSAIEREGHQTQDTVQRGVYNNSSTTERFGFSVLDSVRNAERHLSDAQCQDTKDILMNDCRNTKDILLHDASNTKDILLNLNKEFQNIKLQNAENTASIKEQNAGQFKDVLLQAAEVAKDAALTACVNAKDAALAATVNAKDTAFQAERNSKDALLNAEKNATALAKQLAECCCEMKALVIEKNNATDMLVRQLDNDRVKQELADSKMELLALKAKCCPPCA